MALSVSLKHEEGGLPKVDAYNGPEVKTRAIWKTMSNWSATEMEILEIWSKRHEQRQTNFSERRQATILALTSDISRMVLIETKSRDSSME